MNHQLDRHAEVAAVQARHERDLMRYPNVVGVGTGTRVRGGKQTGEPCLLVFVERKLPEGELAPGAALPRELDGVPVDVVQSGRPAPLT